mmetsp:Transcript_114663/g.357124  ORF Transcript_114663/g.357124 Transcript_114663/m.357124 type:complete len:82 (-) Transcript_114663:14-259(-)
MAHAEAVGDLPASVAGELARTCSNAGWSEGWQPTSASASQTESAALPATAGSAASGAPRRQRSATALACGAIGSAGRRQRL